VTITIFVQFKTVF